MKSALRILACLLAAILCSSCITSAIVSHSKKQVNNIGRKSARLHGKTLQMINRHSALMVTDKNDVVCIITEFDDYYDENILKIKDKAGKIINNTINVYSNTYNKIKYTPFYFIGCFIIFITVGSSITLLILASANDKKQVK